MQVRWPIDGCIAVSKLTKVCRFEILWWWWSNNELLIAVPFTPLVEGRTHGCSCRQQLRRRHHGPKDTFNWRRIVVYLVSCTVAGEAFRKLLPCINSSRMTAPVVCSNSIYHLGALSCRGR